MKKFRVMVESIEQYSCLVEAHDEDEAQDKWDKHLEQCGGDAYIASQDFGDMQEHDGYIDVNLYPEN